MAIGQGSQSTNQARHDYVQRRVKVGFFTDPTLCIGCKACEVACKEYNRVPEDGTNWLGQSYDNTGELGHSSYRHVKFVEVDAALKPQVAGPMDGSTEDSFSWVFLSDVCRHCEVAGCLESCPTGAIVRNEMGGVYVQDDICNGCGYCVVSCPFGVIDRRPEPLSKAGGAFKCTFCYDRQIDGLVPACAKSCPTESIAFGPLNELHQRAERRAEELTRRGFREVGIYAAQNTNVGGLHAFFLTLGDPALYGLPPRPEVPTSYLAGAWTSAIATALAAIGCVVLAFLLGAR